jgi:hypothetical protein
MSAQSLTLAVFLRRGERRDRSIGAVGHPIWVRRLSAVELAQQFAVAWPANAQTVEHFYNGRTVALLIPSSPGGVNHLAARA